jgi:hypothetical protein
MADITTLDPARAAGLTWLRDRLRWEATLDGLRGFPASQIAGREERAVPRAA